MARTSFLLASTLLELMCQCAMVTPVALNGAGCAAAPPAINVDASNKAANILVFMTISLLDDLGLVVWILATRTLSGRLKARKLGTGYGHPRSATCAGTKSTSTALCSTSGGSTTAPRARIPSRATKCEPCAGFARRTRRDRRRLTLPSQANSGLGIVLATDAIWRRLYHPLPHGFPAIVPLLRKPTQS